MFKLGKGLRLRVGILASLCVIVAAVGAAMASTDKSSAKQQPHPGLFSAYIDHGPDRGLAIWGALSGRIDRSGHVSGALKGDHPKVPVTGSVSGRSATLVFHLPGGRTLTGTGKAKKPITDFASLPEKGRFSGPRDGDSGVWDAVRCTQEGRPGLKEEENRYKCVTSEGKVFYTIIPPVKK